MENFIFKSQRQANDFAKVYFNIGFEDSDVRRFDGRFIIDMSKYDYCDEVEAFIANLHNKNIRYIKKNKRIIVT